MKNTSFAKKKTAPIRSFIIRHLREWHRKLGIFTAFFLIFFSLTGIFLNHTEAFSLANQPIKNSWLLDHYGIKPPEDIRFYQQHITITEQHAWLGELLLLESQETIISAARLQNFWLILSTTQLYIFNLEGQLVDQLDQYIGLPQNVTAMAVNANTITLKTDTGYYQSDENMLEWLPVNTLVEPKWVQPDTNIEENLLSAKLRHRSQFLSLERIILDAHSGRIFGDFGVLIMDLIAIFLILVSITGIYIWLRYSRLKR